MSSMLRKLLKPNKFNLSHQNALSLRLGDLVPLMVEHLNPGEPFNIKGFFDARFAPMQAPMMSHVDFKTWAFAVPYRLVWEDYEKFFTGVNEKGDKVSPTFPRLTFGSSDETSLIEPYLATRLFGPGSLSDYLDLNNYSDAPNDTRDEFLERMVNLPDQSMLEPRAYQLIYNECFRDQNIDAPVEFDIDSRVYCESANQRDEEEVRNLLTIRQKRWEKDYFTSALPTPTMADDVAIPVDANVNFVGGDSQLVIEDDGTAIFTPGLSSGTDGSLKASTGSGYLDAYLDPNGTLRAQDNAASIRDLTYSKAIYQFLLDSALGGRVRIKDFYRTMFNTTLPDYRAMIPEYIGGGTQPVIVSEVVQTSETNETSQGNLSGRAVSVGKGHRYYYKATEHTIIMVLGCFIPKPSYGSGLPKRHFKFDRFDYYLPHFDHVGDQEIKRKELVVTGDPSVNEETYGYAPRFAEYKSAVSRVHGKFRGSLAYWTMARLFDPTEPPRLNSLFITPDESVLNRPFFVQSNGELTPPDEHVYLECNFVVKAWRPMSKNSHPMVM